MSNYLELDGVSSNLPARPPRSDRPPANARGRRTRAALYAQIERRVAAAVPIIYLFDASYSYAYRTQLRGFWPNAFNPTWDAYRWSLRAG